MKFVSIQNSRSPKIIYGSIFPNTTHSFKSSLMNYFPYKKIWLVKETGEYFKLRKESSIKENGGKTKAGGVKKNQVFWNKFHLILQPPKHELEK